MGSLPPPSLDFSSINHNSLKNGGSNHQQHQEISRDNLLNLFTSQQDLLNHFFKHLDLSQTLDLLYSSLFHKGDFTFKEAWFHLYDEYPVKYEADRLPPPIVADLNGDGKKEVLVATNDAKIQVWLLLVDGWMEMQPNVCRRKKSSVGGRMEMQPMHIQWIYGDGDGDGYGDGDKYEDETVFRTFSCLSVVGFVNFGNSLCLGCIYIFF